MWTRHDHFLSWFPVVSKYLGVAGLVFCAVVWLLTDRLEPTLLGTFGTLLGLSQGTDALRTFREPDSPAAAVVAPAVPAEAENGGGA